MFGQDRKFSAQSSGHYYILVGGEAFENFP